MSKKDDTPKVFHVPKKKKLTQTDIKSCEYQALKCITKAAKQAKCFFIQKITRLLKSDSELKKKDEYLCKLTSLKKVCHTDIGKYVTDKIFHSEGICLAELDSIDKSILQMILKQKKLTTAVTLWEAKKQSTEAEMKLISKKQKNKEKKIEKKQTKKEQLKALQKVSTASSSTRNGVKSSYVYTFGDVPPTDLSIYMPPNVRPRESRQTSYQNPSSNSDKNDFHTSGNSDKVLEVVNSAGSSVSITNDGATETSAKPLIKLRRDRVKEKQMEKQRDEYFNTGIVQNKVNAMKSF